MKISLKHIYYSILFFISITIIMLSFYFFIFNNKKNPNIVYMPDMYYSNAYEPYSDPNFSCKKDCKKIKIPFFLKKKTSSLFPVNGSIPRTKFFDKISDSISKNGFDFSKKINDYNFILKNKKNENYEEGKKLYNINCSICHGENGDGQGFLVKNEKILGVPNYKDRDLTLGSVYYVITYGKNNMNSYTYQLNNEDRWEVSKYVMYIRNKK
ncbi:c-type cytochrome [Blattabacterium cuenoti]|uniref:c-type cytochrome n=1 Tax=Blattabacterium cuenoti TaxID=1653831 RepID=UPI00163D04C5|nr:cytochrome c [Blattabacterium cuenoti]